HRGRVLEDDRLADAPEAEAAQRLALPWTRADGAPAEPDLHHALAHGRSSATVLPRSAATAPGSFSWVSAAIVARTMLCGLFEPMPLLIASGTSFALPSPKPTRPLPSPTTTKALKLNRRPPFTTLATRLMWTTFSFSSTPCASRMTRRGPLEELGCGMVDLPSELE